MRGTAIALTVMMLGASSAIAQTSLVSAGSLSLVSMQGGTEVYRQADFRLAQNLRLRVESFGEAAHAGRAALVDPFNHRRRMASTFDYYPVSDSGFHLSIGMRSRPKPGKAISLSASNADLRARLDGPAVSGTVRVREDIKRRSPMALAGWSTLLDDKSSLRFDAGAMAIRSRNGRAPAFALADPGSYHTRGTSIGALAQVSFVHRF